VYYEHGMCLCLERTRTIYKGKAVEKEGKGTQDTGVDMESSYNNIVDGNSDGW